MAPADASAGRSRVVPAASTAEPSMVRQEKSSVARPGSAPPGRPMAAAVAETPSPDARGRGPSPENVETAPVADPSTGLKSAADWE
ncbi:MAG: hypothetical protein CVU59_08155, partial [Deltaproteobacteria bacterium HGW-Deltaproteobacteria-17]